MFLVSALALLITLIVWVLELALFTIARDRARERGMEATLGNANWLVPIALVALILGFIGAARGCFGNYSRP